MNQLDDTAIGPFATGRPLEDSPDLQQCKHCKKSILKTAAKAHLVACLKAKKEKAQRKKEQKEARERERKGMDDANKKDDDGDTRMEDDDEEGDEDGSPEKKGPGGLKSAKKSAGKKLEIDDATKKGKKRKADGDAEKGPKQKKKKEEPKLKAPKPKGKLGYFIRCQLLSLKPGKTFIHWAACSSKKPPFAPQPLQMSRRFSLRSRHSPSFFSYYFNPSSTCSVPPMKTAMPARLSPPSSDMDPITTVPCRNNFLTQVAS